MKPQITNSRSQCRLTATHINESPVCPGFPTACRWLLGLVLLTSSMACQGKSEPGKDSGKEDQTTKTTATAKDSKSEATVNNETSKPEDAPPSFSPAPEGKVLRHAVFFSFKESSTEEQIQEVADAFRALPGKIDSIIDFHWGTNNSPENLNDGFTHCFLLTFKDEAGRADYLPHPEHKKFGDVLRPHMNDVFVIDYWGDADDVMPEKALKHAVFFKFKDDASEEDVAAVEAAFAELPSKIDAIKAFEWGKNNSPEKHDDGFTHCFMVTFDSEEGRAAYLPHADHQAFVELLKPSLDQPRVLDFWAEK